MLSNPLLGEWLFGVALPSTLRPRGDLNPSLRVRPTEGYPTTLRGHSIAMDVLYPDPMTNSDQEAKRTAFFNVQLFKDTHEQFGDSPTVEQVKWFLRQKSNAEPPIVEKRAPEVHKVYIESATEISTEKGVEKPDLVRAGETPSEGEIMPQAGIKVQQMKPSTTDAVAQLITKDYGNLIIRNKETVEIARRLLDLIEEKFKTQEEGIEE